MINTYELIDSWIIKKSNDKFGKEFAKFLIDYKHEINQLLMKHSYECQKYVDKHYINRGLVECGVDGKKLNVENDT
jgi:hypothetical protein